jgi:hypothetical protein
LELITQCIVGVIVKASVFPEPIYVCWDVAFPTTKAAERSQMLIADPHTR